MSELSYSGHRIPRAIIQRAVWIYLRFTLRFRDVEELLAERVIVVTYESIRRWGPNLWPTDRSQAAGQAPETTWPMLGWTAPCTASLCQGEVVTSHVRRPSVEQVSRIGMDTSKHIFQLHGVDATERPVLRRKLRRRDMIAFVERLSPTRVAIEACGASHHWARLLRGFGHEVQLIAP